MSDDLIGYRAWRLEIAPKYHVRKTDDGWERYHEGPPQLTLQSLSTDCVWDGPVQHCDMSPRRGNSSGLYALRTLVDAIGYDFTAPVVGEVAMWGKIVQHSHGWRVEHVLIKRLILLTHRLPLSAAGPVVVQIAMLVKILEIRYQCDVVVDMSYDNLRPIEKFLMKVAHGVLTDKDIQDLAKEFA